MFHVLQSSPYDKAGLLWYLQFTQILHGEGLEMVDRLEALGGEVFNEVLTAQTGQKTDKAGVRVIWRWWAAVGGRHYSLTAVASIQVTIGLHVVAVEHV